jgi:hypothetical protein
MKVEKAAEEGGIDTFGLAFEEATGSGALPGDTDAAAAAEAETARLAAEALATPDPAAAAALAETERLAAEAETARLAAEALATPDPAAAAAIAEIARLKAELAAVPKATLPPTDAEKAAEEALRVKADASKAEWETFKADWKEPAEMMEKMYTGIMAQVPAMIAQAIATAIQPLAAGAAQTAGDRFIAEVNGVHAGGMGLIQNGTVDKWIETLPAFQRAGASGVLDKGSAQEVIELLDAYRVANPAQVAPAKTAAELALAESARVAAETEKNRKLIALGVLPDKRTNVTGVVDPSDFSGAYDQAVAAGV